MFRKSSQDVVRQCREALNYYKLISNVTLFGGYQEKPLSPIGQQFKNLLDNIKSKDYSAIEAIISVYQFYDNMNWQTRLRMCLLEHLMDLLDIGMPMTSGAYGEEKNLFEAQVLLDSYMSKLMELEGFENENDTMLLPLRRAG